MDSERRTERLPHGIPHRHRGRGDGDFGNHPQKTPRCRLVTSRLNAERTKPDCSSGGRAFRRHDQNSEQ